MTKEIMLELPCELSPEELLVRGQAMSNAAQEYERVEGNKRTAMKEFTDELKSLRTQELKFADMIRTGIERRLVPCAVEFHSPVQGTKRIARKDTGEFLRDEPMTAQEMQSHLFERDDASGDTEQDVLYPDALRLVFEFGKASTSLLQRRLRIGYGRASSLIEAMEREGVVGPADGSKPREVLKDALTKAVEGIESSGSAESSGAELAE